MKVHWIVKWALAGDPFRAFEVWMQETSDLAMIVDEKSVSYYSEQVEAALKSFPWGAIARVILFWQRRKYWAAQKIP